MGQKNYVLWKANLLKELSPKIYTSETFDKRYNKIYKKITIYTNTIRELIKYRNLFYKGRKGNKIIYLRALKLLKPLGLAVWYMDDGTYNYRDNTIKLHSSMDSLLSQKHIKQYFTLLGMNCSVYKITNKNNWFVGFDVNSSDRFLKLISKFIPVCMSYKLGHLCDDNKTKLNEFREKRLITTRRYQAENKKTISLQRGKHYIKCRKEILLKKKEYALKNPEKIKQWNRVSYIKNRDKIISNARRYRSENHEKILVRDRVRSAKKRQEKKLALDCEKNHDFKRVL